MPTAVDTMSPDVRIHTTVFFAVLTHASRYTNVAPRALTRTCVAELVYSPVRPLVDVKVFRVLQHAINTSKAGPSVALTPIDPSETSCVVDVVAEVKPRIACALSHQ